MTAELVWDHPTSDVPETGLSATRAAAPDELEAVACALGLISCPSLEVSYVIAPSGAGRYALSGTLRAQVVQACVVTLDPVTSAIEESFQAAFWPEEDIAPPRGGVLDLDETADPEPIVGGQIAVGRIVFERLAESLDPYPRKPGATLDLREAAPAGGAGGRPESPFAVLANIKTKR
ncbi:MAG TPA: DUF177 domain-containing protein [Hyphomicrobiaceae bacterium]|nr:DUF177 domain-containing protein [Hyphomicrobiaceae bacterium]